MEISQEEGLVMDFVPIIALGTLVYMFVIFLKNLSAQQWRSAATIVIAWLVGIGGVFLMAATQFADGISIGGHAMDTLSFWSKVLVGLLTTSLLGAAHEFKKAIDRTDTAVVPEWFEPKAEADLRAHLVLPSHVATPEEMATARQQVLGKQEDATRKG